MSKPAPVTNGLLIKMVYIAGEPLVAAAENIGYTMTWRFLPQNRVGPYLYACYAVLIPCQIMTAEPDNIKAILATEFNSFEKGSEFRMMMEPLLGTGVFAADGKVSSSLICTATDVFLKATCGSGLSCYPVIMRTSGTLNSSVASLDSTGR